MKKLILLSLIIFSITALSKEKGLILRFGDEVNYNQISFLDKIICLDSNNCYITTVEYYGFPNLWVRVYKSTNQGRSWNLNIETKTSKETEWATNVRDFDVVDSNHIYIAMSEANILKYTADGGKTIKYLQFPEDATGMVENVKMIDTLKGMVQMNQVFYRTFDGWATYDTLPRKLQYYYSPQKKNDSIIWFSSYTLDSKIAPYQNELVIEFNIINGKDKIIYQFSDEHIENGEMLNLFDLHFVNDSLGFVCGRRDIGENNDRAWDLIYKTTDGGKSWKNVLKDMNGRPFGIFEISFADEKLGVSVGQEKLYETTDGGETWLFKETPEEFDDLTTRVEFAGQIAIVGEMNGNVWTWQYPDDTTGVSVEDLIRSSKLHVIKRQEELRIAITDPQYRAYRLEIIDIMGRKVINKSINSNAAGNVYHSINIKNLNKGSYFFALSYNGAVVHTGKFIK